MIEVVTGLIGGGKSCLAIYRALKYVAEGGRVYMNMRLTGAVEVYDIETKRMSLVLPPDAPFCRVLRKRYKWEYQDGQYNFLVPEDMEDGFQRAVPGGTRDMKVLVILDEVNEWFDSKDRSRINTEKTYRDTLRFMRQSRKVYIDVIFILQVFSTLDNRVRDLVGFVWQCRDMQYFEVSGVKLGFLWKNFFVWQKFEKSMKVAVCKPTWVAKDKQIFECYDTEELFGDGLGIVPAGTVRTDFRGSGRVQRKGKKMNGWQAAVLVVCMLCSLGTAYVSFSGGPGGSAAGGVRVVTVTNHVGSASSPERSSEKRVEWAELAYCRAGDLEWVYADGCMYKPGMRTDRGMVVSVDRWSVRLLGDDGERWIFHREAGAAPKPVSVAANGGAK